MQTQDLELLVTRMMPFGEQKGRLVSCCTGQ